MQDLLRLKAGTGEPRNPLVPITKLTPRGKSSLLLGRSTKRERLCGSGGQSLLLKTETGARLKRSLQHSKPHTRYKVAREYLEEVEAYEQQLEQQQNPN